MQGGYLERLIQLGPVTPNVLVRGESDYLRIVGGKICRVIKCLGDGLPFIHDMFRQKVYLPRRYHGF